MQPETCLFCRIVGGAIPATVVAESEHSLAFRDIQPVAPTHVLVIPKAHVADVAELSGDPAALADLFRLAAQVAAADGLSSGYRMVTNTGTDGGQVVFHAHVHLLGGRGLGWPPG